MPFDNTERVAGVVTTGATLFIENNATMFACMTLMNTSCTDVLPLPTLVTQAVYNVL
jgi:hypothetical protein